MACSGIEALIWMCEFNAEINRFPKTFYCPLLMAFDIYHTAINIDGDGFELALSQELSEEFEKVIVYKLMLAQQTFHARVPDGSESAPAPTLHNPRVCRLPTRA